MHARRAELPDFPHKVGHEREQHEHHGDLDVIPNRLRRRQKDKGQILERGRFPLHHKLTAGQPGHELAEIAVLDDAVERILLAEFYKDERVLKGNAYPVHNLDREVEGQGKTDRKDDHRPRQPDPQLLQMLRERHLRVFHRSEDLFLESFEDAIQPPFDHQFLPPLCKGRPRAQEVVLATSGAGGWNGG